MVNDIMKNKTKVLGILFTATFFLGFAFAIVNAMPSGITSSAFVPETRERWWDERWHYRMSITVDPNANPRRWGNIVEFDAELSSITNLDFNSIRAVKDGEEVPCAYDSVSDTIKLLVDETMLVGETIDYTIYYDLTTNGIKPYQNPLAWVNDYLERYNELVGTEYTQSEIEQEFEQARDDFILENSITYDTVTNIYQYQGYTVQWNPIDERWEFLDGTIVQFYFIEVDDGMGGFYIKYHDGTSLVNFAWKKYDGTWWYWNVQTSQYITWEYIGQSIFMGATLEDTLLGALQAGDADLGPDGAIALDNVEYTDDAWATFYDGSQWVTEDILVTIERGVPEIKAQLTTEQTVDLSAWGSAMFNLNGSIQLNDTFLTHLNYDEWLETEFGWIDDMTPVGGYLQEIEEEYNTTFDEIRDSAERIAIVTEEPAFNIADFDFDVDGIDMLGVYDTGNLNTVSLTVVPKLINSKYFGMFDIITKKGFGIVFNEQGMYTNILIEAWKEVLDDASINYYLNVSFNYLDWWYTPIQDDPEILDLISTYGLHLSDDGEFGFALTYLADIDPQVTLLDILGKIDGDATIPDEIVLLGEEDPSIPIEIGTIIVPSRVTVGQEFEIIVGVKGETIDYGIFREDPSSLNNFFHMVEDFFIINAPQAHYGKRFYGTYICETIGTRTMRVLIFDTNGSYFEKTVTIRVQESAPVIFTWIASIIGGIFGFIGIAVKSNKTKGRALPTNCEVDGSCNL